MALLLFDGFEWSTPIDWTGSLDHSVVSPRSGAGNIYDPDVGAKYFAATTTCIVGMAVKIDPGQQILTLKEGTTEHIRLYADVDSKIQLNRATVLLELSTETWDWSAWHYVELKVTIHDTTGSYEVRVDGVNVLNATGVDTRNGGAAGLLNLLVLGSHSSATYDDLYILDTTGAINNDFLGPGARVLQLLPDSAGDDTDFTPLAGNNYAAVDESPTPDGDTSYVASATSGHRDLYNLSSLTSQLAAGTVQGIRVKVSMKKDDVDAVSAKIAIKNGTTVSYGSDQACAEAYDVYEKFWELNPDDAAQFEIADIDALQIGLEVV